MKKHDLYLEIAINDSLYSLNDQNKTREKDIRNIIEFIKNLKDVDEKMTHLAQHGSPLYQAEPVLIIEILKDSLKEARKSKKPLKNVSKVFEVFRNLDKICQIEETKDFVNYCLKHVDMYEDIRADMVTFVLNYLVFKIKHGMTVDEGINEYVQKLDKLLSNEHNVKVIDQNYLLVLFSQLNMKDQKRNILKIMGKRLDIVKEYFEDEEYTEAIKICKMYKQDPELSILALKLICSSKHVKEKQLKLNSYIPELLELIKEQDAYSLHFVLNILQKNKFLSLKVIKSYFSSAFEAKSERVKNEREEYEEHQKEIKKAREELLKFKTTALTFQPTTCSSCKEKLMNPAVYFFCGHSYHYSCLDNFSCMECQMEHHQVFDKRALFEAGSYNEDDLSHVTYKNTCEFLGRVKI